MKAAPVVRPTHQSGGVQHRIKLSPQATMRFDPPSFSTTIGSSDLGAPVKKLWVEGALPGEEVDVRILRRNPESGEYDALATQIISPAPERVKPKCVVQDKCGGCPLMHLDPKAQLMHKEQEVSLMPKRVLPPLDLPDGQYQYRHKARLSVSARAFGTKGVFVGFRERLHLRKLGFVPIVDMNTCEVLAPPLGGLIGRLREMFQQMGPNASAIPNIEAAVGDNTAALVFRNLTTLRREDEDLLTFFGDRHKLQIYLQPGGPESVVMIRSENGIMKRPLSVHHAGSWHKFALKVALPNDVTLHFLPTDFTQVNLAMNRLLISRSMELLDATPSDTILDFFSGIGNFSLPLAKSARHVTGLELIPSLVFRAQENTRLNNIANASFRTMDLYKDLTQLRTLVSTEHYTKILLDPPRSGAFDLCKALTKDAKASHILYVSCNPHTLARDAAVMTESGKYVLDSLSVANMFPHTGHVESMGLFIKV